MLKLVNVRKEFPIVGEKEQVKVALDNLSIEVKDHEFLIIIGGNGTGKTTLLNVLSGALPVTSGNIFIDDLDITKMNEYKRAKYIGRVFQDPTIGTSGDMSILENLELAYRRGKKHSPFKWGFNKAHKEEFIESLKQFNLGLENHLSQKVCFLSGGQRQALTLLMASMQNPKFLLLDEHTAALDPGISKKVMEITDKIVRKNKLTTIMITHKMTDAVTYGDRLIMLNKGRVAFELSKEEKSKMTPEELYFLFKKKIEEEL